MSDDKVPDRSILYLMKKNISDFFRYDLFSPRTRGDIVSNNAKVVLYALFALVGFVILLYALTILGPNFKGMDNENTVTPSNNTDSLMQQLEESEQQFESLQQVNSVYIAAISGALALGGTLIAQLWGRTKRPDGV